MEYTIIPNNPDYEITKCGEVRNKITNTMSRGTIDKLGYVTINFKTLKPKQVHQLIALTFIPNPNDKKMVDHIDRNPSNNSIDNLRWVTHQENMWNRESQPITLVYRVCYSIGFKKCHLKYFDSMIKAEKYLEELKIKYPRVYTN